MGMEVLVLQIRTARDVAVLQSQVAPAPASQPTPLHGLQRHLLQTLHTPFLLLLPQERANTIATMAIPGMVRIVALPRHYPLLLHHLLLQLFYLLDLLCISILHKTQLIV
jgi:hypothetical protein